MSKHQGVSCDNCQKNNFAGKRYKCLICYDFDLCADCYRKFNLVQESNINSQSANITQSEDEDKTKIPKKSLKNYISSSNSTSSSDTCEPSKRNTNKGEDDNVTLVFTSTTEEELEEEEFGPFREPKPLLKINKPKPGSSGKLLSGFKKPGRPGPSSKKFPKFLRTYTVAAAEGEKKHNPSHPMQCILTSNDYDICFGGIDSSTATQNNHTINQTSAAKHQAHTHSFTCPFCGTLGFTDRQLYDHVIRKHPDIRDGILCPICAGNPSNDPNCMTTDFPTHFNLEHKAVLRDLNAGLPAPQPTSNLNNLLFGAPSGLLTTPPPTNSVPSEIRRQLLPPRMSQALPPTQGTSTGLLQRAGALRGRSNGSRYEAVGNSLRSTGAGGTRSFQTYRPNATSRNSNNNDTANQAPATQYREVMISFQDLADTLNSMNLNSDNLFSSGNTLVTRSSSANNAFSAATGSDIIFHDYQTTNPTEANSADSNALITFPSQNLAPIPSSTSLSTSNFENVNEYARREQTSQNSVHFIRDLLEQNLGEDANSRTANSARIGNDSSSQYGTALNLLISAALDANEMNSSSSPETLPISPTTNDDDRNFSQELTLDLSSILEPLLAGGSASDSDNINTTLSTRRAQSLNGRLNELLASLIVNSSSRLPHDNDNVDYEDVDSSTLNLLSNLLELNATASSGGGSLSNNNGNTEDNIQQPIIDFEDNLNTTYMPGEDYYGTSHRGGQYESSDYVGEDLIIDGEEVENDYYETETTTSSSESTSADIEPAYSKYHNNEDDHEDNDSISSPKQSEVTFVTSKFITDKNSLTLSPKNENNKRQKRLSNKSLNSKSELGGYSSTGGGSSDLSTSKHYKHLDSSLNTGLGITYSKSMRKKIKSAENLFNTAITMDLTGEKDLPSLPDTKSDNEELLQQKLTKNLFKPENINVGNDKLEEYLSFQRMQNRFFKAKETSNKPKTVSFESKFPISQIPKIASNSMSQNLLIFTKILAQSMSLPLQKIHLNDDIKRLTPKSDSNDCQGLLDVPGINTQITKESDTTQPIENGLADKSTNTSDPIQSSKDTASSSCVVPNLNSNPSSCSGKNTKNYTFKSYNSNNSGCPNIDSIKANKTKCINMPATDSVKRLANSTGFKPKFASRNFVPTVNIKSPHLTTHKKVSTTSNATSRGVPTTSTSQSRSPPRVVQVTSQVFPRQTPNHPNATNSGNNTITDLPN